MILIVGLVAGMAGAKIIDFASGRDENLSDKAVPTEQHNDVRMQQEDRGSSEMNSRLSILNASSIRELEHKMSSMSSQGDKPSIKTDEGPVNPLEIVTPELIKQREAAEHRAWKETEEEIASEPIDPRWAQTTEDIIQKEMQRISEQTPFETLETICHSTSCSSRVEFANYQVAKQNVDRLIHASYGEVNCQTGFHIPKPEDPTQPYQATILFRNCIR